MQDKAYEKGSVCPPCDPGKVRIYSMRFCPYAQRVLLIAGVKNIPHDIININLGDKPAWFLEKHSEGKVPLIESKGKMVSESLIISEYLDEIFPENKLFSEDPFLKATDKILIEKFGMISGFFNSNYPSMIADDKEKWDELSKRLDFWEELLTKKGTTFFYGNKPGMLDLMIWPWMERIYTIPIAFKLQQFPKDRFPTLTAWIANMLLNPAIKMYSNAPELQKGYFESRIRGEPNFDFGL